MAATSTAKKSSAAHTMPIEGYDKLSVKAILPYLPGLSDPELRAVTAHEKAGKNRVTLLQAVRKVELAREATSRPAPASHLSVVEELPEPVAVPEPTPRSKRAARAPKAKAVPKTTTSTAMSPDDADDDEAQPRSRAAVKAATWEEELRPQLPRRIEASSYDFEPPTVALAPPVPPAPMSAPRSRPTAPAGGRRKLEGPVLIMAAVLAVLLGLAIGTILARTGSSTSQSTPASVTTQAAAATTGG